MAPSQERTESLRRICIGVAMVVATGFIPRPSCADVVIPEEESVASLLGEMPAALARLGLPGMGGIAR